MSRNQKTGSFKPKPTKATQREGVPYSFLYDWVDIPFAASVLMERRNLAWKTYYNASAAKKFQSLEGHTANEVTMLIASQAKLKIHFGKLSDGKPYWFGKLNDRVAIIRVFAADQATECAKELLLLADGMRGYNSTPFSPDFFATAPEWDAFTAQLHAEFGA